MKILNINPFCLGHGRNLGIAIEGTFAAMA
jgi:hypothetical protein